MSDPFTPPQPAGSGSTCACPTAGRLGPTHALILLIAVLALGSGLFLAGTPLSSTLALLSGCGAIGAATLTAVGGGRRLVSILLAEAVRSSAEGRSS